MGHRTFDTAIEKNFEDMPTRRQKPLPHRGQYLRPKLKELCINHALEQSRLKPAQVTVLQTMVDEGHAKALDDAASILDLQEIIIHPPEHMWGP